MRPHRLIGYLLLLAAFSFLSAGSLSAQTDFVTFESGHVRPIVASPDGSQVFAVNTPDNRLEVFDVTGGGGLVHVDSIPVGMEPVAVAARSNSEVWVVNHLSDSVSIVDLSASPARVSRTLLVGDEPRDIVFAGTGGNRAFITTAHRGQHRTDPSISAVPGAGDPQLTTAGIPRADVWVFDATSLGSTIGGTPVQIVSFFADTPRALAVSPDGNTVYAAAFHSGNQTTAINETVVCDGFGGACGSGPGGVPGPSANMNPMDVPPVAAPETGIIVKFDGAAWRDSDGLDWSAQVNFDLPDHDVFSINANTLASGSVEQFDHVGTILFNMAVNPISGRVYVTNTELPNHIDFEGPGNHGGSTVQGRLSETRITVIDPALPSVSPKHLNQHIDYSLLHTDVPDIVDPTQINHSLATPMQPVVSSDGNTIYMPAFGSAKIGVFSTSDIEDVNFVANFDPTVESANYISTTGGGPSGLVLDEGNNRLYVLTRFDNSISVIDLTSKNTVETHLLNNPEPPSVVDGRPFLYDAVATSGNGEASCSSCHIFGDMDDLAWNLGNPDDHTTTNNQPAAVPLPIDAEFHPMKGPMTTQTLRGMATHGSLHWRGDRVDGFFGLDPCTEPSGAACSEDHGFNNFIVAFEGLVGKDGTISNGEMQEFTDFALQILLPPNPVRNLDNSLTADQANGEDIFFNDTTDTIATCDGCHTTNPSQGFFGTGGAQTFEGEPQTFKVAHMRNLYAKIGMFGQSTGGPHTGDQVRGFGFLHDGSVATVKNFLEAPVFSTNNAQERDLEQFGLAFPTDLAPIVGQQVTLTSTNSGVVNPRIDLFIQRAAATYNTLMLGGAVPECDLVVKGSFAGSERGWVRESGGLFRSDVNTTINDAALRALATTEGSLTYTCAPPGSGTRMGINRDDDTHLDGLDNCPGVTNQDQADGDSDGIGDVCDTGPVGDFDGDGFNDDVDNCPLISNSGQENFDGDAQGDVCDDDDDNDGLDDTVETNTGTFVSPSDTGSDPFDADSDNDGFDDGIEVSAGTDPNDDTSFPSGPAVPVLPFLGQGLLVGLMIAIGVARQRRRAG